MQARAQRGRRWPVLLACLLTACLKPFEARHQGQWDASDQILESEQSQVMLRAAQSRLFDTGDKQLLLAAVVATMQDLGFVVEELDEVLGIAYGQRFDPLESEPLYDASYHLYDNRSLLLFTRSFHSWGPFDHRCNLVRLTVTVRKRNDQQLVVRASAQYYLQPVEQAEPYQRFFQGIEGNLARAVHMSEVPVAGG